MCLPVNAEKQDLPKECPNVDHKCLIPFFYPNHLVLKKYEHAIHTSEECDNLKQDVEDLKEIVASKPPHRIYIRVPKYLLL